MRVLRAFPSYVVRTEARLGKFDIGKCFPIDSGSSINHTLARVRIQSICKSNNFELWVPNRFLSRWFYVLIAN